MVRKRPAAADGDEAGVANLREDHSGLELVHVFGPAADAAYAGRPAGR
jgi:hypothetical protein